MRLFRDKTAAKTHKLKAEIETLCARVGELTSELEDAGDDMAQVRARAERAEAQRDAAWAEDRIIREAIDANPEEATADEVRRVVRERNRMRSALQLLHDNTADYVRINNLGDPYQNADMRMARDALQGRGQA
jgi:chromosome segregation ATPase